MKNLKSKVCPWVGCGGTIVAADHGVRLARARWICNICGETFASIAEYEEKLYKETKWAEAWIEWSREDEASPSSVPGAEEVLTTEAG